MIDWNVWWIWVAGGIILVILEVFLPVFWFLGFAVGALIIGLLLGLGVPLGDSPAITILLFSVFSLIAWYYIRKFVGVRKGQLRVADRDINED